jgi:3-(3-hydroxy-phenyl)propionate hydroxylase/6-hydroxy-3-succinoylpyridine 3-monooxygenase
MRDGRLVGVRPTKEHTRDSLVAQMVGREIDQVYPERDTPQAEPEPLLELIDVSAGTVQNLSVTIPAGTIVGIGGLEGQGQHELAEIALRHLERLPGTLVLFDARLTGLRQDATGVTATAGGEELRAAWLIGADGARSTVRSLLGLPFEGFTWPERFVATNVFYDFEAHGYARSVLQIDPVHGAIIAKIDDRGLWRVTYSEPADLPEDTVGDRVAEHYAALLPGDEGYELDRITPYKMHQRSAPTYRAGRVLLAGDAAHATNPTGGLGLTSGMFDSFALQDALGAVAADHASDAVLDDWAQERRRIFTEIASPQASENKRLIYSEPDPARRRRDVDALRAGIADRDALRQRLHFTRRLESRSTAARRTTRVV